MGQQDHTIAWALLFGLSLFMTRELWVPYYLKIIDYLFKK
jgi:hypothetical protein